MFHGRCYSYGRRFLHNLPICTGALCVRVADLARERSTLFEGDTGAALALDDALDEAVGSAYGLDSRDWSVIRSLVGPRKI
jgi:hypothetical protein